MTMRKGDAVAIELLSSYTKANYETVRTSEWVIARVESATRDGIVKTATRLHRWSGGEYEITEQCSGPRSRRVTRVLAIPRDKVRGADLLAAGMGETFADADAVRAFVMPFRTDVEVSA